MQRHKKMASLVQHLKAAAAAVQRPPKASVARNDKRASPSTAITVASVAEGKHVMNGVEVYLFSQMAHMRAHTFSLSDTLNTHTILLQHIMQTPCTVHSVELQFYRYIGTET